MPAIQPFILGRGKSGQAIARCLALLRESGEFDLGPISWLERGEPLRGVAAGLPYPVLFIANPHGLHAKAILEAERAGFARIFCEKPACAARRDIKALREVKVPVAVFHGYRLQWGPQTLKAMIRAGELGELIAIEGRYWQSSAAERALAGAAPSGWKNDLRLSGPHDVLLDLATHWTDLAIFLMGQRPNTSSVRTWKTNAEARHRDTHVHVALEFSKGRRALGSVSKTAHGAQNELEIHVLGSRKSASWSLLRPDELVVGEGAHKRTVARRGAELGGRLAPFHGLGWLDGYVEIIRRGLSGKSGYPTLAESLAVLDALLP